jgi:serine/threonine protein kinase
MRNSINCHQLALFKYSNSMDFASKIKGDPMDRYQKTEKLGEGTYGIVYKAKDRVSGDVMSEL